MNVQFVTRRRAIQLMGAALGTGGVSGCGAVVSAGRVVIQVAFRSIDKAISAIVKRAGTFVATVIVAGVDRFLEAALSCQQVASLEKGGTLVLRTQDGAEHVIPYTVR